MTSPDLPPDLIEFLERIWRSETPNLELERVCNENPTLAARLRDTVRQIEESDPDLGEDLAETLARIPPIVLEDPDPDAANLPPSPDAPRPGDRYTLLEEIGKGGWARSTGAATETSVERSP